MFWRKHSVGRQDASSFCDSTLTADRVLAPTGNSIVTADRVLAPAGNSIVTADRVHSLAGNSILTADKMLPPFAETL